MERAIYMILGMVMLAIASGAAQEIEIPEDAPRETWQMIYDDYRSLLLDDGSSYKNLTKDITVVRVDDGIYIQGIANECPDSWVKATFFESGVDEGLLIWTNQPIVSTLTNGDAYLITGNIHYDMNTGTTYWMKWVDGNAKTKPLKLKRNLDADGVEYETPYWNYDFEARNGYWIQSGPNRNLSMGSIYYRFDREQPEEDLEYYPAYLNPRLVDKTAGIGGLSAEDEEPAPIYTLSGVKADREHLMPGVYVSRGKKIIIK